MPDGEPRGWMAVDGRRNSHAAVALIVIADAANTYAARTLSAEDMSAPIPAPKGCPPQEIIRPNTLTLERNSSGAASWR